MIVRPNAAVGLGVGAAYCFWVTGSGSTGLKRYPCPRELGTIPPIAIAIASSGPRASVPGTMPAFCPPEFPDPVPAAGVYYAVDAQVRGRTSGTAIGKFLDLLDRSDHL